MANPPPKAAPTPEKKPDPAPPPSQSSPTGQSPSKDGPVSPGKDTAPQAKTQAKPESAKEEPPKAQAAKPEPAKEEPPKAQAAKPEPAKEEPPKAQAKPEPAKTDNAPAAPKAPSAKDRIIEPLLELFETGFKKKPPPAPPAPPPPPPAPPLIKVGHLNLTPKDAAAFNAHFEDVISRAADGALLGAVNAIARPIKRRLIRTMIFVVIWTLAIAYGLHEASNAYPISFKDLLQIGFVAVLLPATVVSVIAHHALR